MIKEFTFIALTYNHERYITRHLESVKTLAEKYGRGMEIRFILSDDCSKDRTVGVARDWLNQYGGIFRSVTILESEENQGLIRNLTKAIRAVKTENFKYLAGDDAYYGNNIFELYPIPENALLVTPLMPLCENGATADMTVRYFRLLLWAYHRNLVKPLMRYANFFPAPGVFCPCETVRSEEYLDFLSAYRHIEDAPSWQYLLFQKKMDVKLILKPYVLYRIGSGISTDKKHAARTSFDAEWKRIQKTFALTRIILPKYINPFCYAFKLFELDAKLHAKEIDGLLSVSPELSEAYAGNGRRP